MVGKYKNRQLISEEPCIAIEVCLLDDRGKPDKERFTDLLKKDHIVSNNKTIKKQNQDHCPKKVSETDKKESVFAEKFGFFFFKVTGQDELMDAYELQTVMQMIFGKHLDGGTIFSLETCRCLIAAIDRGIQGSLGYKEFKMLWFMVMKWKHLFEVCDRNKDHKIDNSELVIALQKLDFELATETVNIITNRYMNRIGTLNLDDFCGICSKLTALKVSYDDVKNDKNLTYDKYFMESLYS